MRIYAKFSQETSAVLGTKVHGLTVVNGPLQEIIPMDPGKGVYMIAYSDNASAKKLHKIQKLDKEEQYRKNCCKSAKYTFASLNKWNKCTSISLLAYRNSL